MCAMIRHLALATRFCVYGLLRWVHLLMTMVLADDHDPHVGKRIGEAANPGPFVLEIANVTHAINNAPLLVTRKFDAMIVQEHSVRPSRIGEARRAFGRGFKLGFSPLDTEKGHDVWGHRHRESGCQTYLGRTRKRPGLAKAV